MMLIILIFSRFFHCNVIIECFIFVLVFLIISPFMGSCKCRRGLSDTWSACFYCSYVVFSVFFGCDMLPK